MYTSCREGVDARVMLSGHLLASAQAAGTHDLARASTACTWFAVAHCARPHTVSTGQVACAITVEAPEAGGSRQCSH